MPIERTKENQKKCMKTKRRHQKKCDWSSDYWSDCSNPTDPADSTDPCVEHSRSAPDLDCSKPKTTTAPNTTKDATSKAFAACKRIAGTLDSRLEPLLNAQVDKVLAMRGATSSC